MINVSKGRDRLTLLPYFWRFFFAKLGANIAILGTQPMAAKLTGFHFLSHQHRSEVMWHLRGDFDEISKELLHIVHCDDAR